MKKFSMAPIQKYTSHGYEKMCFVPNFRRISASRQSNKSEILNNKLTIWYLHSGKFTKFCTRDEFMYSKVQYGQILLLCFKL